MFSESRKILIIACGGTFVMSESNNGGLSIESVDEMRIALSRFFDSLEITSAIQVEYLWAIDSTDMNPAHWEAVANLIARQLAELSAVVILTGTNTLAYFSSALSFALRGIPIPVVLTGSQIPAHESFSDARVNFVNALRLAERKQPGVYVVFAHRIILGSRAKKVSESELDAFCTFNASDIGSIGVQIRLDKNNLPVVKKGSFKALTRFCPNLICLTVLPGMTSTLIRDLVDRTRGIILRSFGSGDLPRELFDGLEYAREREVPVVNTTQCRGSTLMGLNEIGREALSLGVIQAFDMSMESMTSKLMWLNGQQLPYVDVVQQMESNLAGELRTVKDRV